MFAVTGRAEGGCSKNSLIGVNIGLDALKIEKMKFVIKNIIQKNVGDWSLHWIRCSQN